MSTHTKSTKMGSSLIQRKNNNDLHCRLCEKSFENNQMKHKQHFNIHWRNNCVDSDSSDEESYDGNAKIEEDYTCLDEL